MRVWRRRSGFSAVASVALVVAACGSSGGDGTAGPSVDPSAAATTVVSDGDAAAELTYDDVIDPAAMRTAWAIVDRLGPDAAFGSVVLALDAGYDHAQIDEHAAALGVDGVIPGVAPSGVAAGVFSPTAAAGFRGVAAPTEPTPESFLDTLHDKATRGEILTGPPAQHVDDAGEVTAFIGALLFLKDIGYSFDQIVEGLYFGQLHVSYVEVDDFDQACILLVGRDGTVTAPVGPAAEGNIIAGDCNDGIRYRRTTKVYIDGESVPAVFPETPSTTNPTTTMAPTTTAAPTTTTAPTTTAAPTTTVAPTTTSVAESLGLPRTYVGVGSITTTTTYATGSCATEGSVLEITLLPDGTITGTYQPNWALINGYISYPDGTNEISGCQEPASTGSVPLLTITGSHTLPSEGTPGHVRVQYVEAPHLGLEGDYSLDELWIEWRDVRDNPAGGFTTLEHEIVLIPS